MKRKKLSERVSGYMRRLFKADYRLLRLAGLTRAQAIAVCLAKYAS